MARLARTADHGTELVSDVLHSYGPEVQLCVGLARPVLTAAVGAAWREHVQQNLANLDWGAFFALCAKHKVLPLVAKNIQAHNLHRDDSGESIVPWAWVYEAAYRANCLRGDALAEQCSEVLRALEQREVSYALRKGLVASDLLYGDVGARRMNDIDLLIPREQISSVAEAFADCDFTQGHLDSSGQTVLPFDRETRILWRLKLDNALPFARLTGVPDLPFVEIDVAHALFHPSRGESLDAAQLLSRRVRRRVAGLEAFTLNEVDFFLDICTHFHKETVQDFYVSRDKALGLSKFLDVALASGRITSSLSWPKVVNRARQLGVGPSVHFALRHAALFYTDLANVEALASFDADLERDFSMRDCGVEDDKKAVWADGVLQRMFRRPANGLPAPVRLP